MSNYLFETTTNVPIKHWTKGVMVEDKAMQQLRNVASLPFMFKHLAAMPDMHYGIGATVGSVIATKGAVCPASVGVDIGCGVICQRISLKASDLPDNLNFIRSAIESVVPHGRTDNGKRNDKGSWNDVPQSHLGRWKLLEKDYEKIITKHPKAKAYNTAQHMGTLGGGNHFIELCIDENQDVWILLHSGSRGVGNKIGSYFIEKAKLEMEKYFIGNYLPDKDLAYLVEHSDIFDDYVFSVEWAQKYAMHNRQAMMDATISVLKQYLPDFTITEKAVNCHHNYISREVHYKEDVIVTRKGAVSAQEGELGVILGSMGTGSFVVKGLGNHDSFCSCSHGAGRVMSRGEAKRRISIDDHKKAMKGIEARLDEGVLDESPAAYKDINAVMAAQTDLVEVLYSLHQVLNIKG